jgi:regulatory protein
MTTSQAKQKLYRYCAYQERCHKEVKQKLEELKIDPDTAEEIIGHLISEGFLNEERFTRNFASGKFRLKHWGRIKIVRELEQRNVSANCIKEGLKEITETDYLESLSALVISKANLIEEENIFIMRDKIARYAITKGFEPDLVWQEIKRVIPDKRH